MSDKYASLRLFNAVVADNQTKSNIFKLIEERGVVIAPSAMHRQTDIHTYANKAFASGSELNSTFYSNWVKVKTVDLETRLNDQLDHYFSTYGLESLGINDPMMVYLPDAGTKEIPKNTYVLIIKGIAAKDLQDACLAMLASGVALKEETIKDILYILKHDCKYTFTGSEVIKNREAQVMIYDETKVFPKDSESILRYLVYKATGETLIIKNKTLIDKIKVSRYVLPHLDATEIAKTFNRYKPLWLAFKYNKANAKFINRVSKLSKTLHTPMKPNVLANITSLKPNVEVVKKACEKANPFQIARALNAVRHYQVNDTSRMYHIRNGKVFITDAKGSFSDAEYENALTLALKGRVSQKKVYIPEGIDYALPVSEKMFSGNVPTGSSIVAPVSGESLLVGIYWEDDGVRTDLDLSAVNLKDKIGWNGRWRNTEASLMYSGDMTSAYDGAAEWLYMNEQLKESYLVTVNLYSGPPNKKFKVIVGYGPKNQDKRNYMIDPSKVIFEAELTMKKRQMIIGVISPEKDNVKFTLMEHAAQNSRVTFAGGNTEFLALDYALSSNDTSLRLRDFVNTVDEPELADVDLSMQTLTKDALLNIFE